MSAEVADNQLVNIVGRTKGDYLRVVARNPDVRRLLRPRLNDYIPHEPHPKQSAFLLSNGVREVMFGGSGGAGKSDALLMGALQYVDVPGYSALLLRNSFADLALPGALMDRARQWLTGTGARWNDQTHVWLFPSGAQLAFGYIQSLKDMYRYKSSEFQYIGFDELTQFAELVYRYMFTRLRRLEGSLVPLRMRSGTNPGGPGHDWVQSRFLDNPIRGRRIFLPARLVDNPSLDRREYIESLNELDPVERARMLAGDWSARPTGNRFDRRTIPIVDLVPSGLRVVRFWDLASSPEADADETVGFKLGHHVPTDTFYVLDIVRTRSVPAQVERLVRTTAQLDGVKVAVRMWQDPGQAGVSQVYHYARLLTGFNFAAYKQTGDKEVGARPLQAVAAQSRLVFTRGRWTNDALAQMEYFPVADHDDVVDAGVGAHRALTSANRSARKGSLPATQPPTTRR